jgi:hypothetical protein
MVSKPTIKIMAIIHSIIFIFPPRLCIETIYTQVTSRTLYLEEERVDKINHVI